MYNSFTAGFGGVGGGDGEGHEEAAQHASVYGLYQPRGDLNPASACV
jgi:hypothetical protein